jgi:hypothetical protein
MTDTDFSTSSRWQIFALGKVGDQRVGQAEVDVERPILGQGLVWADGVVLGQDRDQRDHAAVLISPGQVNQRAPNQLLATGCEVCRALPRVFPNASNTPMP